MLVTDRHAAGGEGALVRKVSEAVEGGVNVVRLREKDLHDNALEALARRLKEATAGRAVLIINGAPEVALAMGADGVHLAEGVAFQRPAESLIAGRSVHSLGTGRGGAGEGADYLIFGPIYETASHREVPPAGSESLARMVRSVRLPVVAIGGITAGRVPEVIAAGAAGIAVISAILGSPDPRGAAEELREALAGVAAR